jgi:uncharacterized oxidoreductase
MQSSGHVALITGGATGIGLALARTFLHHGNQVILVGRRESALQAAAALLPGAVICVADVSVPEDRERLAAQFPHVTVLVNNAGTQVYKTIEASTPQEIEDEIAVNFAAPILLAYAFLPVLRRHNEAAIVNVTSGLALVPKQATAIYCATKAGLHSATQSLRWQLEGSPVSVFEVLPPFVATAMTTHRGPGGMTPEQLAQAVWSGFIRNRHEMLIGATRWLKLLHRIAPGMAMAKVRHRI